MCAKIYFFLIWCLFFFTWLSACVVLWYRDLLMYNIKSFSFFSSVLQYLRIFKLTLFWWMFFHIYDLQKTRIPAAETLGVGESWKLPYIATTPCTRIDRFEFKNNIFGRKYLANKIQNLQKSSKNDLKIGFCTSKEKLNICLGSALYL